MPKSTYAKAGEEQEQEIQHKFSKYFFTGNHILSWMVSKEPSSAVDGI